MRVGAFNQLNQDTPGTGRMHEDIAVSSGANPDFVIDKASSGGFQACDSSGQIRNLQSKVMKPLSALLEELRDGRVRNGRFKQLDAALADRYHGNTNFF